MRVIPNRDDKTNYGQSQTPAAVTGQRLWRVGIFVLSQLIHNPKW